ncbi:MAG: 7-carboxy-7-deazaguanine synthase [Gammaproteobacteria bacterium]|nr:7-carboxy-7-deazaguanine synthase [Gammaproteobacteria bacterium]
MTYSVKEIYYTLQGEGARSGRPAVLLRFAGCNLWSGREQHRASAVCRFCDTEFLGTDGAGGGKFGTAADLARAVVAAWPADATHAQPYVVCTGGEPLLQLDTAAIDALHAAGFEIGVESNGTIDAPDGIDWLCISPKGSAPVRQRCGNELKLVYPQPEAEAQPEQFAELPFEQFYLQPLDDAALAANTRAALQYCLRHPRWQLSLQTHKILGIG